jgi:hypothetical protein
VTASYASGPREPPRAQTIGEMGDEAVAAHASSDALVSREQEIRWSYLELRELEIAERAPMRLG